jgi:peptidoglycan/LPS O-acetylase OafA/YrhL
MAGLAKDVSMPSSSARWRAPSWLHAGPNDATGRLGHIDALRAIAALLVVWMHVSETYLKISPVTTLSHWVYDVASDVGVGRIGVVLFFAISGFVIPFSIRTDGRAPARDFLLRRAFRILPLYWLSIPIGAFACHMIWGRAFPLHNMLLDMTLMQYLFGWLNAMGLYWTLALEALFYLACSVLLLARSIDRYARIAIVAATLIGLHVLSVSLFIIGNFTTFPYLSSLWYFHLGIMFWGTLYRAWWEERLHGGFAKTCMWGLLATLLVFYPLFCGAVVRFPTNYYLGYPLAIAIFVVGTTFVRLSWRPLAWMGEVSYSIYLLHPIVFNLLLWILMRAEVASWWRTRHLAAYVLANMILTVLLAGLTYRWIEQPAIAFGRRLSRHWFGGGLRTVTEVV